jgi:transcriptional regulator with XRE-family HTH domain
MAMFNIKMDIASMSRNNAGYTGFMLIILLYILGFMKTIDENTQILLGRRIRSLRNMKDWTQQKLGEEADINYKFLGEIERGLQNPSFNVLVKIASALGVDLPELFRFEQEIIDRKEIERRIKQAIKTLPDDKLHQILMIMRTLYPLE